MLSLSSMPLAFAPVAAPVYSRSAVRSNAPQMLERREVLSRAGALLAGFSAVEGASAKAGQFSKLDIFSVVGEPAISSPYQPGGPKAGADATYGYAKSDGPILAAGYESDVTREKAAFDISAKIVSSQGPNIESKTWWLARDNLRGQAYNMKANMQALNKVAKDPAASSKAYTKFWSEINALDLACTKKELDLAKKEYSDVLAALAEYKKTI